MASGRKSLKLGVAVTHPIQYQVPLYRYLQAHTGVDVHAFFLSDHSVKGGMDRQFGVPVKWDIPLLEGYAHKFLRNRGKGHEGSGFFAYNCADIGAELREGDFDGVLVAGYNYCYYLQAIRAGRKTGAPVLMRAEFTEDRPRSAFRAAVRQVVLRNLYKRIDAFLSIGRKARQHLEAFGVSAERIFNSPYCVDNDAFAAQYNLFRPRREQIRAELGIPADAFVLLYCGKFYAVKAPFVLADALAAVGSDPKLCLVVAGDGEMRPEFESRVKSVMGERLKMLGFVNQKSLGKCYAAADCLVLPSHRETWGLVVNEAMVFHLPAIVSDRVGCQEDLVTDGETGLVFPKGNATALAACISRFLSAPDLAARMGEKARARVGDYTLAHAAAGIVQALHFAGCKRSQPAV